MSYNPIEKLRDSDVQFLLERWITDYDANVLVNQIRLMPDRVSLIHCFLFKIINYRPEFCFDIIYDLDEFEKETKRLLTGKYKKSLDLNSEKIANLINKTSWGEDYIYSNLNSILSTDELNRMKLIVSFAYDKSKQKEKWISEFTKGKDMHKRALFLISIIELYPAEANKILSKYEDIIEDKAQIGDQIAFFTPRISEADLSEIVVACLHSSVDKSVFENLKKYLFDNCPSNNLAELLLSHHYTDNMALDNDVFFQNIDQLFLTSRKYKFIILRQFKTLLSEQILEEYNMILKLEAMRSKVNRCASPFYGIYAAELGDQLERIIDQYLSLSSSDKVRFLKSGSMSSSFQIGDYVLKLGNGKWSYEDPICPNIYLILKNLEEYYIRDKNERIIVNMEVQQYLKKKTTRLSDKPFLQWQRDLASLGYYTDEKRSRPEWGENFGILDSYRDADCSDPELLPDHFKKLPLVLFDHDLVFKNGSKKKVLHQTCGD